MNMKRYVQHISGQGEKWEIYTEWQNYWSVHSGIESPLYFSLPKSAFVLCEPPEEWEDVTDECREDETHFLGSTVSLIGHASGHLIKDEGFRVRKIDGLHNGPAFIVERKKS